MTLKFLKQIVVKPVRSQEDRQFLDFHNIKSVLLTNAKSCFFTRLYN